MRNATDHDSLEDQAVSCSLRNKATRRDDEFDLVYPPEIRRVSATFWTPVEVAGDRR